MLRIASCSGDRIDSLLLDGAAIFSRNRMNLTSFVVATSVAAAAMSTALEAPKAILRTADSAMPLPRPSENKMWNESNPNMKSRNEMEYTPMEIRLLHFRYQDKVSIIDAVNKSEFCPKRTKLNYFPTGA